MVSDWKYDVISIGYPGKVHADKPTSEPWNLAKGWKGFNFKRAFKLPVKVMNDAAMQALGSYRGGKMLFLGLGTGLGSAIVLGGVPQQMELGHLPYKKGTFEDYVGSRGLEKYGRKQWRRNVNDVVERLIDALSPDDVVMGGGNVKRLKRLPKGCRPGSNNYAFLGGFRLWTSMNSDMRKSGQGAPRKKRSGQRQTTLRKA
jgi:polyphosphate glucokinase